MNKKTRIVYVRQRLNLVEAGKRFRYNNKIYVQDLTERLGSGTIPVKDVKTGEKKRIKANVWVEMLEEIEVVEPTVLKDTLTNKVTESLESKNDKYKSKAEKVESPNKKDAGGKWF